MSYNPNYNNQLVEDLKLWLNKNKSSSIKEFAELHKLDYDNFRRFLSRIGFARYENKRSNQKNKVVFTTLDPKLYALVKAKSKKSEKTVSEFIRDIIKSNLK
jgi:hypothetical protein